MKYLILCLCFTLTCGLMARSQLPDFPLHANGLLYSDTLMGRLRHLADSVRARASLAGAEGDYYSPKQTTGRLVRLDTGDIYGAFKDFRKGISLDSFLRKYPRAEVSNKILVLLDEMPGYQVAGNAYYYNITADDVYYSAGRIILPTDEQYRPISSGQLNYRAEENSGINGNCVYSESTAPHSYRGKFSNDAYVFAFYLDRVPTAAPLPKTAKRLIRYRDWLVDTAIGVFDKDAGWSDLNFSPSAFGPAQGAFDNYAQRIGDPAVPDSNFTRLLAAAMAEVQEKKFQPFIYLDRYMDAYSPVTALAIRRSWHDRPTCGLDHLSHRIYVMHIAYLAAELGNWPVFLQAQMAVAVDPDGEYPDLLHRGHRTYFLRELEELNIGIDDILLANQLVNTWCDPTFSGAKLLGNALALEGGDRRRLEENVLKLIADNRLDTYHRLAMHYLFSNYVGFLPEGAERRKALARLARADGTLPDYLAIKK